MCIIVEKKQFLLCQIFYETITIYLFFMSGNKTAIENFSVFLQRCTNDSPLIKAQ